MSYKVKGTKLQNPMGFLAVYIPQYRHHRDKSQLAVRKPVGRFNYRRVQNACK